MWNIFAAVPLAVRQQIIPGFSLRCLGIVFHEAGARNARNSVFSTDCLSRTITDSSLADLFRQTTPGEGETDEQEETVEDEQYEDEEEEDDKGESGEEEEKEEEEEEEEEEKEKEPAEEDEETDEEEEEGAQVCCGVCRNCSCNKCFGIREALRISVGKCGMHPPAADDHNRVETRLINSKPEQTVR